VQDITFSNWWASDDQPGDDPKPLYRFECGADGLFLMPFRSFGEVSLAARSWGGALVRLWYERPAKMHSADVRVPALYAP
jgi:hypothetical protein